MADVLALFYYFVFASFLIVVFVYDFKHKLIPDFAVIGIAAFAAVRIAYVSFGVQRLILSVFIPDLLAAFATFVFFCSLWYFSGGKAMGFGDVKIAPVLVLFLGMPKGVLAILLSFWIGAIFGIMLLFMKRAGWKSEIPFGPFLALGALIALLWGEGLIRSYFNFF